MSRSTSKFGDFSVHIEWQKHKSGEYQFKSSKKDRKKVGELRKTPDGSVVYWIFRRAEDLVFCKDSWAIDFATSSLLMCLGRPDVGIIVSNGDRYRMSFAEYMEKRTVSDDPKQRCKYFVPFADWAFERGEPESIESSMRVGKWK